MREGRGGEGRKAETIIIIVLTNVCHMQFSVTVIYYHCPLQCIYAIDTINH